MLESGDHMSLDRKSVTSVAEYVTLLGLKSELALLSLLSGEGVTRAGPRVVRSGCIVALLGRVAESVVADVSSVVWLVFVPRMQSYGPHVVAVALTSQEIARANGRPVMSNALASIVKKYDRREDSAVVY